MKWYYIKNDHFYVEITVAGMEFDIGSEESEITYSYKKVIYQNEATRFELSSQAWHMMYEVVKSEGFDVFLEEEK